jgi:hypothetical protein
VREIKREKIQGGQSKSKPAFVMRPFLLLESFGDSDGQRGNFSLLLFFLFWTDRNCLTSEFKQGIFAMFGPFLSLYMQSNQSLPCVLLFAHHMAATLLIPLILNHTVLQVLIEILAMFQTPKQERASLLSHNFR